MAESHYTLPRAELDKPAKLLIVTAPFYRDIADHLIAGATTEIEASGATHEIVEVPGALEIATAIGIAERLSNFDGYVALGCVIRGETTHYETVCNDSSRALTLLGLQGLCIGNGILTVENHDQAEARANPEKMNKGAGAAAAALHLIALGRKWGGARKGVGFIPDSEDYQIAGKAKDTPTG
ncbi:6,7-dimethyl-8-ribityllumazine synthase [Aquicoccus porphyridii]|uniref:6,7-dimethyl-8-ribityllumazine synthase n=1 Tax=Aquicoccus porphyridii TaxID=1852029 RepID=A0A5A9ZI98_9RHOB|nr:6,7-dimethyl-8-ribityllumazine synthase [Aquicoccus porphyridii]KAA0916712.1 6,7-dimethyl-8-ribityllumazine synthase [Aquicoccus porphyridii]RAI53838.1 6,7-dimethyl-8-ribityllumazine synthase [Rhodobacteraceae bacterium AsT-22]